VRSAECGVRNAECGVGKDLRSINFGACVGNDEGQSRSERIMKAECAVGVVKEEPL